MATDALPLRVERVPPVRPVRPTRRGDVPIQSSSPQLERWSRVGEQVAIELDGPGAGSRLAERWGLVRRWWAQTTFYLFSPDSWRR